MLDALEGLVGDVGIPGFESLSIGPEHFPWIAEQATANNSNPANPQEMTPDKYAEILAAL